MDDFAKLLILLGITITIVGVIWWGASRLFGGATLPGPFTFQIGGMTCFFPIIASIVASIILTIVLNLILRWLNR